MAWPTTPTLCTKTDAFTIPTLLGASPSDTCTAADAQVRAQLADLSACDLVDRPELYVLGYDASNPRGDTDTLEHLIGLAGEGFAKIGAPPDGILPPEFVPTLRVVIDKIRHDALATQLASAKSTYAAALSAAQANAGCFDATALAQLQSGIGDLTSELDAASAYLEQLKTTGEAANAQENLCLAAKAYARNTVLYPSLTQAEREFVAFWLGAVYWRMRGGGLIPLGSTQDARIYFLGNAFARIGDLLDHEDATAIANAFVLQVILDGWGEWQDMGHTSGGGDKYADLVGMTERGERQAQAGINVIKSAGWDTTDLLTGGLQMGPGYFYAWESAPTFLYGMVNDTTFTAPPYSSYIDGPTAIGEFNMGGALALGMARTLLAGKPTNAPPTVMLCENRTCGDDGCGGSCGSCATGSCVDGQCVGGDMPDAAMTSDGGVVSPDASTPVMDKGGACSCDLSRRAAPPPLALLLVIAAFALRRRTRV